jgi:TolB-like protein
MNRVALHLAIVFFAFAVWGQAPSAHAAEAVAQKIAVVDLDYVDTSGEVRDQSQFHAHLVRGFSDALSHGLEASGKFHSVALRCGNTACTSHDAPSDLQKAAQAAGVKFVLFGGFHKMSTLVQWAKIEVLDATTGRIAFDRLVTFRNDTEDAWQRAESFILQEILSANIATGPSVSSSPIKLAVFDFELLDFSGGAGLVPESADDRTQLQKATDDARRLLAQSGRYTLVDVSSVDDPAAKTHELRKCDGCEAAIAKKLGADQAFLGIVTRITRTDYAVTYRLRDATTGKVIDVEQSDLRIGANYSWNRGAVALVEARLLKE